MDTADLFGPAEEKPISTQHEKNRDAPLADRLRPMRWDDFQTDSAFDQRLLKQLKKGEGRPPSMVLWGPPGTGKTTFARLVGASYQCHFEPFSAVLGGVKEVREIVAAAARRKEPTILFVDEIHRFNRAQQDAFLPHVEAGTIVLIGATTENPSFYLTGALLSRTRLVVFPPLSKEKLAEVLSRGLESIGLPLSNDAREALIHSAGGDARRLLNLIENLAQLRGKESKGEVSVNEVLEFLNQSPSFAYDRAGDHHFDAISAFIKSLRGSDPDAALFWGFRMLESGDDPRYLCRRMIVFASEDIGNADPHALPLALATAEAFDRLGMPEGQIPLSQCIIYLATAPKSNRSLLAMSAAIDDVKAHPRIAVPLHLRNAPTKMMKSLGHGKDYDYPHDHPEGFVPGIVYLPPEAKGSYYTPSKHGDEADILDRMKKRGQIKE